MKRSVRDWVGARIPDLHLCDSLFYCDAVNSCVAIKELTTLRVFEKVAQQLNGSLVDLAAP